MDWTARYSIRWTDTDKSGICAQTLTEQNYDSLGGDVDPVLGDDTLTRSLPAGQRSFQYSVYSLDWARMGDSFVVRATDCAGNTATSTTTKGHPRVDLDAILMPEGLNETG